MSGGGGGGGGGGHFTLGGGGGGGTVCPSAECPGGHCTLVQNVRGDIPQGGTGIVNMICSSNSILRIFNYCMD